MNNLKQAGNSTLIGFIVIIIIVGTGTFIGVRHSHKTTVNSCITKTLSADSSNNCVSDAQTLANWTAYGLEGTKYSPVTGTFDAATVSTAKLAQTNSRLLATGTIDSATWKAICSVQDAPAKVIAAAKNAGC